MNTETINCNNCGAPLNAPAAANYVTCTHCGTQLAIKRTESVVYTEKLEHIGRRTDEIADQVWRLTEESELARIDREWELERENYMIADKHGHRSLPNPVGSLIGGGVAAIFGLFWTVQAVSMGAPGFFPLFGVIFIAIGLFAGFGGFMKAQDYQSAHRRYRARRASLHSGERRERDR